MNILRSYQQNDLHKSQLFVHQNLVSLLSQNYMLIRPKMKEASERRNQAEAIRKRAMSLNARLLAQIILTTVTN